MGNIVAYCSAMFIDLRTPINTGARNMTIIAFFLGYLAAKYRDKINDAIGFNLLP